MLKIFINVISIDRATAASRKNIQYDRNVRINKSDENRPQNQPARRSHRKRTPVKQYNYTVP